MKIVVQRVKEASVVVEGKIVGEISQRFAPSHQCRYENDTQKKDANWLIKKSDRLKNFFRY